MIRYESEVKNVDVRSSDFEDAVLKDLRKLREIACATTDPMNIRGMIQCPVKKKNELRKLLQERDIV